ncbi:MAG: hypothetical protein COV48_06235 [Elusimicrobia bacterium CG11_big_fil_rev_8_21_14_0_20_64_6]|nr:MAG: hypothetical protein COV48_06235 [Elusimicrobia bacterium CG11_big_fil_rev_8_21_14_0_20_64_6]
MPATNRKVHIYELTNRTRGESLLVVTEKESAYILARLRREPPPEAGSWQSPDEIDSEILTQHMNETAAEQFLNSYLEHMRKQSRGFRVWRA